MPRRLRWLIGGAAVAAPALHVVTDIIEWTQQGFSALQLWLNYVAFLPMPVVLVGLYAVHQRAMSVLGLLGALLYGAAFVYFAHTTLYALAEGIPNYAALWARLGPVYTSHGAVMVVGGVLFGWAVLRADKFPRWTALVFLAGIALNLVLALLAAPEILQTIGSVARNCGLIGMGYATLRLVPERAA
jgi:hypothetical protein